MLRTIVWFLGFGFYMLGTLIKYINLKLMNKLGFSINNSEYIDNTVKNWAKYIIRSIGVKVEVIGLENLPEGNCVFVGNHQGNLDIPLVLSQVNKKIGFIAKKELEKAPILSSWMREMRCVFMDRDNPREAIKSINEGIEYLNEGYSLVIFPEGTRSKGRQLSEFKKGSMKLGLKSGVPIVPLTVIDSFKAFEEGNKIKAANVKLIIDKPIDPEKLSKVEQNNLSEILRNLIEENLKKYA